MISDEEFDKICPLERIQEIEEITCFRYNKKILSLRTILKTLINAGISFNDIKAVLLAFEDGSLSA